MPVHLYGNVCDMDKIRVFANRHKLFVIEDNAEAFGGAYKGKKTGTLGEITGCRLIRQTTRTAGMSWPSRSMSRT
jgi:dTDP-4-amino-4,6-dideoxygalactose transaminase